MIKENDVKWVDLRFTDTKGKEQHGTLPVKEINDSFFEAVPSTHLRSHETVLDILRHLPL